MCYFSVCILEKNNHQVREELESRGCQIRTGCEVHSVLSDAEGEYLNSNVLLEPLLEKDRNMFEEKRFCGIPLVIVKVYYRLHCIMWR